MNTIRTWLQGKKTWLTAISTIAASIGMYASGSIDEKTLAAAIVGSLMACFIGAKIDRAAK